MRNRFASLVFCLVTPFVGYAQDVSWDDIYWNPQPIENDLVLPMPCGAGIVFRRVETTLPDNWMSDVDIQLGNSDISGQEHSESIVGDGLAGGLTSSGASERYYLIGKYEISADQYRAVMEEPCPTPSDDGSIPAEGMTWIEAQEFTARLTTWLYKNARDEVATFVGSNAYVRLPTEAEWEFAARGGLAVNDGARRKRLFEMDGALENYAWFSGFKSCDGLTQPIGLLEPNPLGLFDVLGNVQEMTSDLFRLRKRERFHGQVGGVVARGGSCLTQENRMRLSQRDEVTPYDLDTGEARGKSFTGLRVVFGSPILSGQSRITSLNEGWFRLGEGRLQFGPEDDPIETLTAIAEAETDPDVRDAIERAQSAFA